MIEEIRKIKEQRMMRLSDWIIVYGYCATRVLYGTDSELLENRIAFIKKTPRVRIAEYTTEMDDQGKWFFSTYGGTSEYGFDEDSRAWCDKELIKLGYTF